MITMREGKPSRTACKVALNLLALGTIPKLQQVLPEGTVSATEKLLLGSGAASAKTVKWALSPRAVKAFRAFEWLLPGQFESFAYRKAFCEDQVRKAIVAGAGQVLVLGAGYDTLAWRLAPEFPGVEFFEIDQPATAGVKAKGIDAMGRLANHHLIARDLGEHRLTDVLAGCPQWDNKARAVFVAEGLFQYLPPPAVSELFNQCAAVSNGAWLAFTYVPSLANGRPDAGPMSWLVLWIFKAGGEPWLWSIHPARLEQFLNETGWNLDRNTDLQRKHGVEMYAVAVKSVN